MEFSKTKEKVSYYDHDGFICNYIKYGDILRNNGDYHTHTNYEIIFIKKGDITYTVEGKSYHLKKGSLLFIRPGERHRFYFKDTSVYERYDIFFYKETLFCGLCDKIPMSINVLTTEGQPFINELFKKIDYYSKHFEGEDLRNLLLHLTEEVLYNIVILSGGLHGKNMEKLYSANPTVIKAVEYVEKNIDKPFTLENLCKELFITKSHLHRLFSEHLEITPKKYINTKRLILAQKKIRQGEKPTQIYPKCGFSEYSTFWREYKNYFGYSPSEEADREIVLKTFF